MFGPVASTTTLWRLVDEPSTLVTAGDLSDADACPGAGVGGGAAPDHDGWLHLDLDAPITIDHSD